MTRPPSRWWTGIDPRRGIQIGQYWTAPKAALRTAAAQGAASAAAAGRGSSAAATTATTGEEERPDRRPAERVGRHPAHGNRPPYEVP